MPVAATSLEPDPLLLPYLRAAGRVDADRQLELLISGCVDPIVRAVIRRKLQVSVGRNPGVRHDEQEAEDVYQDAIAQLLVRLSRLKQSPDNAIANFRGYVSVTAASCCDMLLRRKYPKRGCLKNRLLYLMDNSTNQTGFARWDADNGDALAGFAEWRADHRTCARSSRYQQLLSAPQATAERILPREDLGRMNVAALVAALFSWVGHPFDMDDLVGALARILGIKDEAPRSESDAGEDRSLLDRPDGGRPVAEQIIDRDSLLWLWERVKELPEKYRAPLLLNLRDQGGGAVIDEFPRLGVASIRQIADVVAIPAPEFAAMWRDLPLDDNAIASRLGISRQDVINRRMLARRSLGKSLRAQEH